MSETAPREVPAPLARRLADALQEQRGGGRPDRKASELTDAVLLLRDADPQTLTDAALTALRAALDAGDDRDAAFHLLTADALLTAACEVAAMGQVPEALDAGRFAALLETQ